MPRVLALFDLDGTLTSHDTMFDFLRFHFGFRRFFEGVIKLFPSLLAFKVGLMNETQAKEKLLTFFLKNLSQEKLQNMGEEYKARLSRILIPQMASVLNHQIKSGACVAIVTASLDIWVEPWCKEIGALCLASRSKFVNGIFTGRLEGKNCRGEVKVERIRQLVNLEDFDTILAWGDSKSDFPMLRLATKAWYKGKPWNKS